jgi:RHS repeat-associated protein
VKRSDEAGVVVHEYRYDAWGNIKAGVSEPGYAFTGRELDPETGLYYYRARYYDPRNGRFISEDPLRFEEGSNFYLYVDDDPVTVSDPPDHSARWAQCTGGEGVCAQHGSKGQTTNEPPR